MPSTTPDLITHGSQWRPVVGGVVAVVLLTSIVGGVAGVLVWSAVQAFGMIMP